MTNELKPCPFCGSEARGIADGYVFCDCGASAPIEAWNTRAERTCRWTPADFITEGEWWDAECGEAFTWEPDGTPNHCPNCGAKVVD